MPSAKQGIWKAPVGEALDATVGRKRFVGVPGATAFGRSVEVLKLKFWSVASHDVERTPRAEFNDGSRGPVAEQLPQKAISAKFAGLIDAAEYETMTLVEG